MKEVAMMGMASMKSWRRIGPSVRFLIPFIFWWWGNIHYKRVILNGVKNLCAYGGCIQILRLAQNDTM